MAFWKRKKRPKKKKTQKQDQQSCAQKKEKQDASASQSGRKKPRFVALEIKLLAMEGMEAGLESRDLAKIIGVSRQTIDSWHSIYEKGGLKGQWLMLNAH